MQGMFGQQAPFEQSLRKIVWQAPGVERNPTVEDFVKFDLDLPGGTPGELVEAIEEASGKPLNAIVPKEHADSVAKGRAGCDQTGPVRGA